MKGRVDMLFYRNLEEIIFNRHDVFEVDELDILSGYVGPQPVRRLDELPIKTKLIYGMYGAEGIRERLHNSLTTLDTDIDNLDIYYSTVP